jgi:vacuolar-type H+-ATPase subunit H
MLIGSWCIEKVTKKAQETIGIKGHEAEGKAKEVAGEAKGKASELEGQAKGKAEELRGHVKP